jgi:hypothetical protein
MLDDDDDDEGEDEQSEGEDFYDEGSAGDDEDDDIDGPESDDGDEDFGVKKKKPKAPPKVKLTAPKTKRELTFIRAADPSNWPFPFPQGPIRVVRRRLCEEVSQEEGLPQAGLGECEGHAGVWIR